MGRAREKFSATWVNMTKLGERFGVSAIHIGWRLKELGLRHSDGRPDPAVELGWCRYTPLKDGTPFWLWHAELVTEYLSERTWSSNSTARTAAASSAGSTQSSAGAQPAASAGKRRRCAAAR